MRLFRGLGKRRAPRTPAESDRRALSQLQALGADLTKPRHVIHFLYFPDEAAARRAAAEVSGAGYTVEVVAPGDGFLEWRVHADTTRVVGQTTVEGFRSWFEGVASAHGGEYDGWEAARTP